MNESGKRNKRIPIMVNEQEFELIKRNQEIQGYKDISSFGRASMMRKVEEIPPKNKCIMLGVLQKLIDENKGNEKIESRVKTLYRLMEEM